MVRRHEVEVFDDGWWFMYSTTTGECVDLGLGPTRNPVRRRLEIWAAHARQWMRRWQR